ncbi:MAG: bifunctional tetrahydrofolate synthase/dihydrofolate synthase [Steroidobacteraceae bacterium]
MASPRSLDEWLRKQETVHGQAIDLGLARVRAVAQRLQLLPFGPRTIIVAGTNGKGSTVAWLDILLRNLGHRVGAFTSPHLLRYNERIQVAGAAASDSELIAAFNAIDSARGDTTLTFFEYNALAALYVFRERQVDIAVLEVGLGGRLDAVNIVDAEAAIVCSIGLDHADWLGTDIEVIGREKAGVFRPGAIAVIADAAMTPSVEAEARQLGAHTVVAGRDYSWLPDVAGQGQWTFRSSAVTLGGLPPLALPGRMQLANVSAALAVLVAMQLLDHEDFPAVAQALRRLQLAGRFQIVPGPVEWILDVAHNEPAAQMLAQNLRDRPCAGKTWCVTAILGDKDVAAVAGALAGVVHAWILCGIDAPRGLPAAELARRSPVFSSGLQARDIVTGMHAAAASAQPGDRIVVCGSFLAVAPAMQQLGLY